jgi:uncharacterized delta-60 repeat protein
MTSTLLGPGPTIGRFLRRTLVAIGLTMLVVVIVAFPAAAAPGALDPSFSTNGWVATNFGPRFEVAFDVAISEANGKIVAAGHSGPRIAVVRYLPGGALDPSFSGDGKVLTNPTPGFDAVYAVAVQPDGKVVVAGKASGSGGRVAILRYTSNGRRDAAFGGGDGLVMTNVSPKNDYAWAIAIQPLDQKIVVAGGAGGAGGRFLVARYKPNGARDGTFGGGDGRVLTNFTPRYEYVDAVAIDPDGKIVAVGSTSYFGSAPRFALARYQANGSLDGTFGGGDGKVITNFPGGYARASGVAIQPLDQKIVVAGQSEDNTAIARYLPDGALDPSFSTDGRRVLNLTLGGDYADEVMVQLDGKIVVAGTGNYYRRDTRFALARLDASGGLDTSFGGDGVVRTNLSPGPDWATGALLQPADGKVVVVGRADGRFVAVRYLVA